MLCEQYGQLNTGNYSFELCTIFAQNGLIRTRPCFSFAVAPVLITQGLELKVKGDGYRKKPVDVISQRWDVCAIICHYCCSRTRRCLYSQISFVTVKTTHHKSF